MATENTDQVTKDLNSFFVQRVQQLQKDLLRDIKEDTPVKTGTAQSGWYDQKTVEKIGDVGSIRNEVPYIGWLEFGTDRFAPFAMVRGNLNKIRDK